MSNGRTRGGGSERATGWQGTALALTQFSVANHVLADLFCEAYSHVMAEEPEEGLLERLRAEPPNARKAMYDDLLRRAREADETPAGRFYVLLALMLAGIGGQRSNCRRMLTDLLRSEADRMSPAVLALVRNTRDGRNLRTEEVRPLIGWSKRSKPACAPDYIWISLGDTTYNFSKPQERAAVRALWEANGKWVHEDTIQDRVGSGADQFRLKHVFRRKDAMNPAWGTLVESRGEGVREYRIRR